MYNHNIRARRKPEKKLPWEVKSERMYDLLNLVEKEKKIGYFDAQTVLHWGDGTMDRIIKEVLACFPYEVRFDKEKRELIHISVSPYPKQQVVKHIGKSTQCKTTLEPTKLSDNELNIMHTMKLEVKNETT